MAQPLKLSSGSFNTFWSMKTPIQPPCNVTIPLFFHGILLVFPCVWLVNVLTFDQPPGLNFIRISHKPGSSTYVLKCWLPSPLGCSTWPSLQAILYLYPPGAVLFDRAEWMGNATKSIVWSTKALHSMQKHWIYAGLKVNENRGHYTTRQKVFGDQFDFKGCFQYVLWRYSVSAANIRVSDLPGAVLCFSKAQASSHMKTSRICSSQSSLMGCDCNNPTFMPYEWYMYCYVNLDRSSSARCL